MSRLGSVPELEMSGPRSGLVRAEDLDRAAQALGMALPPSYRAFVQRYGFGLSAGLFIVYVPAPSGHAGRAQNLVDASRVLARELGEALAHGWIRSGPRVSAELVRRLVPFAYSENGHRLAWDPGEATGDDELAIYAIGRGYHPISRAAPHLGGFFERALRPGMDGMFGRATFTLEPTFEPWQALVE